MTHSCARSSSRNFAVALAGIAACAIAAPAAHAGTSTFPATADAHVQSDLPATNFGAGARLLADGDPQAAVLLRFAVSGISGPVTAARLRLFANNPTDDGPSLYRAAGAWTEAGVTWNGRPAPAGAALGKLGAVPLDAWVEYDVTAAVTADGTYDFLLASGAADGSTYHSREAAHPPELVVTTGAGPGPTSAVDVTLMPASGVTGAQRVNFAVPLAPGQLHDGDLVRVLAG